MNEIRVPIEHILHVASVVHRIRESGSDNPDNPLYVLVREGELELREGTNISFGVRRFEVEQ